MQTMERDPEHIAKTLKLLRKTFGLTQENLADAAGVTTRTIEKAESGRHRPDEQTTQPRPRPQHRHRRIRRPDAPRTRPAGQGPRKGQEQDALSPN
ncbi:MAG: helix-turn-helix transcriptional regulator [Hydrogenophilaceae bacterium]|nr:helix-turn-helix transcriptional regulator [Hydrogenophilaceae bacterium]